jgi:hypothetical protein
MCSSKLICVPEIADRPKKPKNRDFGVRSLLVHCGGFWGFATLVAPSRSAPKSGIPHHPQRVFDTPENRCFWFFPDPHALLENDKKRKIRLPPAAEAAEGCSYVSLPETT